MKTRKSRFIAIVGGSGTGKSWLAERLSKALKGKAARLCLDNFYLDRSHLSLRRRDKINFDNPRAIDWEAVREVLRRLKSGKPASVPIYNFSSHSRLAKKQKVKPEDYIIFEGLWLLRDSEVRETFDYSIYLDVPAETCLNRRLKRDCLERGRSKESVRQQFTEHVLPMHERYVAPQAKKAKVIYLKALSEKGVLELARQISLIEEVEQQYERK